MADLSFGQRVNTGAKYGERNGSELFFDEPISQNDCDASKIPDCLFSMDIDSIVISFDKIEETIKGFSMTFVERGDG